MLYLRGVFHCLAKAMPAYFVTGTDTEIGKTHVSAQLVTRARRLLGWNAAAMKPIYAGENERGENDDVRLLAAVNDGVLAPERMCVYGFAEAASPHIAAARAERTIELEPIAAAVAAARTQVTHLLVEGVGGWYAPLSDRHTVADLAAALDLPVILVVGLRLGCLNHAQLTAEAIARRGLTLAGWIGNQLSPAMPYLKENLAYLRRCLPAPCLGVVPYPSASDDPRHVRWPDEGTVVTNDPFLAAR